MVLEDSFSSTSVVLGPIIRVGIAEATSLSTWSWLNSTEAVSKLVVASVVLEEDSLLGDEVVTNASDGSNIVGLGSTTDDSA